MKQFNIHTNRLGFSKNWKTHINVLNYSKALLYQIGLKLFLFNILKNWCFRFVRWYPVSLKIFMIYSTYICFFWGCFLNFYIKKLYVFRYILRKKRLFFRSKIVLFFNFKKLEIFFRRKYKIFVQIKWFNFCAIILFFRLLQYCESRKMLQLSKFHKFKLYLPTYTYLLLSLYYKDATLFSSLLSYHLQRKKNHKNVIYYFLFNIKSILKVLPLIKGLTICIAGKLYSRSRSVRKWFSLGKKVSNQRFVFSEYTYNFCEAYTPLGTLGIRVWLC